MKDDLETAVTQDKSADVIGQEVSQLQTQRQEAVQASEAANQQCQYPFQVVIAIITAVVIYYNNSNNDNNNNDNNNTNKNNNNHHHHHNQEAVQQCQYPFLVVIAIMIIVMPGMNIRIN